jgi:hypothetical protein
MSVVPLFQLDPVAARAARDDAIARVELHADDRWKLEAKGALWDLIQARGVDFELTTDDVSCSEPREPRAWGPIMLAAAKAGYIVNTGRVRPSASPRCHARPKTVWRVLRAC